MKLIKEYINFNRGVSPKETLKTGKYDVIPEIISIFKESRFEVEQRDLVIDVEQEYTITPEHFYNQSGYPKYEWDNVADFVVSIKYMIDLHNMQIIRRIKVTNPYIQAEYKSDDEWDITSLNPQKIYEEVSNDIAVWDIADAAEFLWEAKMKEDDELFKETWEDEEVSEAQHFQRGVEPKKAMNTGMEDMTWEKCTNLIPGDILVFKDKMDITNDSKEIVKSYKKHAFILITKISYFDRKFDIVHKHSTSLDFSDSKIEDWRMSPDFIIANFWYYPPEKPTVFETQHFQRNIEPKDSMGTGMFNFNLKCDKSYRHYYDGEKKDASQYRFKGIRIFEVTGNLKGNGDEDFYDIKILLSNKDKIHFTATSSVFPGGVDERARIEINKKIYEIDNWWNYFTENHEIILAIMKYYEDIHHF